MYICVKCRKEMRCSRNSVGADYGRGHVYPGDKYICKLCGYEILATVSSPINDPDYNTQDAYIRIKDGGA